MELDVASLLQNNDTLLLFSVLAFGLLLGRIKLGGFEIGTTAGVLLTALVFGNWGFDFSVQTESLGFMLFIFCIGIEAGPNFFSTFAQDGVRYVAIALVVALTGALVTLAVARVLELEPALAAGMLAGALTSTPTLVGAQDAVNQHAELQDRAVMISQVSVGYAVTYVVGLVGLLVTLRFFPRLLGIEVPEEARRIAAARGLGTTRRRNVRSPILRAYLINKAVAEQIGGKTLREYGLYERAGLIIERIKRDGKLMEPDSETVLQEGDRVALVGYPSGHARSEQGVSEEVYDPDLLEFTMSSERVVVNKRDVVGKALRDLNLEGTTAALSMA